MQFKVDENLPVEVAQMLRGGGHDASTINEQQMSGQGDPSVAALCRREGRALVTLDRDFSDIRTYPPEQYAGLIVFRLSRQDKPRVLDVFGRVVAMLDREPLAGHLWVVDEHSVRMRGGQA